jgi:hypothetical protein
VTITLNAGQTLSRVRTQIVPAGAPMGIYHYNAYAVTEGDTSTDSFMFAKLGSGIQASDLNGWTNTGEEFNQTEKPILTHNSALITSLSPNPFNPTTTIRYQMPAAGYVSLKVNDTAGRLIAILVEDFQQAGFHQTAFNGSNMVSGVYFVRMRAGDFTVVQKIVIIK